MRRVLPLDLWPPRILALAVVGLLAFIAMDALEEGGTWVGRLIALAIHMTPTWILLILIALAWKREWLGAIAFTLLATGYAVRAWPHVGWILWISGSLLGAAALYALAWPAR
ncbi:MAG: hypothetical protein H6597_06465 [Flavobacteriales bacterium]|nr:hypothetical protein [Flavobacteriales bacterium]MCB9194159.1 hypothetical protein [Flavobacteriales bacterium]